MTIQYSTTHRNNSMADITTQAGTTPYLLLYTGSPPANCAAAATGTLLASLPCTNPLGAAPSGGVLTFSPVTSENAVATGVAGYWRLSANSGGTAIVAQGTVGTTSSYDLVFAAGNSFTSGQAIAINSFTITANGA